MVTEKKSLLWGRKAVKANYIKNELSVLGLNFHAHCVLESFIIGQMMVFLRKHKDVNSNVY